MSATTLAELTVDHLGDSATEADLAAFVAAARAYAEAEGVDEGVAIDAIWDDGDCWPNVVRWAPEEATQAETRR
jgi:hypothetical protein